MTNAGPRITVGSSGSPGDGRLTQANHPPGFPGRFSHGPAAKPETEPDKRKVGATARRRDDMTFRARSKFRTLPKRRLNVYEP